MNILLICSAGMSTSMLVTKMQAAAKEQNIEANIWATGDGNSADNVTKADVIMLGPQVRYLQKRLQTMVNNEKPVVCIDMLAYGKMDGKKVLDDAIKLYNETKGE
ncbi:MAG: PTS sugar transporter subunit IIB [Erysipelotrichaceae bacterium]